MKMLNGTMGGGKYRHVLAGIGYNNGLGIAESFKVHQRAISLANKLLHIVLNPVPAIAAAFLVKFDNRKGYVLAWQRSVENIQLDGVVEFKCLPSGLHNVDEDLVYFILDDNAGISAFVRKADNDEERNARMLSVGVLVPIEVGRMGKSWLHATALKDLARKQIERQDDFSLLEEYWNTHKISNKLEQSGSPASEPSNGYQKPRALSTSSILLPARTLTPHHPALALPELIDMFGPLIFPLVRSALLHQRILILGEAPVEQTCNFVYDISIMSSLSRSITTFMPIDDPSKLRLQALFSVGIADIPTLSNLKSSWIACTTDDVLCTKPDLFDLLVLLPNTTPQKTAKKTYPRLIVSTPELATTFPRQGIRATQRDARRFYNLKRGLRLLPSNSRSFADEETASPDSDTASSTSSIATIPEKDEAVEPLSWSLMAYTSLIWWASAGDRRSGLMEAEEGENEQDEDLLRPDIDNDGPQNKEVALVAYFHRLSTMIFSGLSLAVRRATVTTAEERYRDGASDSEPVSDSEDTRDEDARLLKDDAEEPVEINEDDMRMMGLDVWSDSDKKFIENMIDYWWGRKSVVRGGSVECCGMRVL